MQAADQYTVTRRALDMEDYIDILRRHKAWIFGPAFAGIVVATVVAFLWPDTYVSTASLRVTPPQIPERFATTNINQTMNLRINSMANNIMSRSTLTNIIQTYGLYPKEQKSKPIEDIIERMKMNDIRIGDVQGLGSGGRGGGVFSVSFSYENRYLAQKVAQHVITLFIDENARQQATVSGTTREFLASEVEQAKKKLEEIESNLTAFRIRNVGHLPDERQGNVSTLGALDQRLASLNSSINRVNSDKMLLESQLRIEKDKLSQVTAMANAVVGQNDPLTGAPAKSERLLQLEREVLANETLLISLKEHYKEIHPDVKRVETNLAMLRRQRDEESKKQDERVKQAKAEAAAAAASATPPKRQLIVTREMKDIEGNIMRTQTLIQSKENEIDEYNRDITRIHEQLKQYQGRLDSTPLADQKYAELIRDYDQAKQNYSQMTAANISSERGERVDVRKQGESLEILDPATLPFTPTLPKRPQILGVGAISGLLLGLVLAGFREVKDSALKNLKDVRAYTQLTILGCLPLLENDLVVRRRKRLSWLAWSTALLVGVMVMSGSVFFYYSTRL
jgi:succinoglycan biosynthesis transport protein ExoP